jgi:hypothetical protein
VHLFTRRNKESKSGTSMAVDNPPVSQVKPDSLTTFTPFLTNLLRLVPSPIGYTESCARINFSPDLCNLSTIFFPEKYSYQGLLEFKPAKSFPISIPLPK